MATYVPIRVPEMTWEQAEALRVALLRAKASELSEVRRAETLASTGYENRAGGTLPEEAVRGRERIAAMQLVIDAINESIGDI